MRTYLNTLLQEKGIDQETIIEVEGKSGMNFIPLAIVVDFISTAVPMVQEHAKNELTKIDFHNGDVMHYFKFIAGYLAK